MFDRSVGKKPVPNIASSRTSTGGSTGVNPARRAGRARSGRARARAARCRRRGSRSASRTAAPRAPCRSGRPRCARAARSSAGGSPTRRSSTASSSVAPSGADVVRGVRARAASAASRSASAAASSSSAALSSVLDRLELLELLRRRLALQLRRAAELVDPRHERAPALVGLEQAVERVGGALARERGARRRPGPRARP